MSKFAALVGMKRNKKKLAKGGLVAPEQAEAPAAAKDEEVPPVSSPKARLQPIKEPSISQGATFKVRAASIEDLVAPKAEAKPEPKKVEAEAAPVLTAPKKDAPAPALDDEDETDHASLVAAIMARRKMAAGGGEVKEDVEDLEALAKEDYADEDLAPEVEDAPEAEEEDTHDMVSAIRRRMRK